MSRLWSCCLPDTNVLIDFNVVGALDTLLRLPFRWVLPDALLEELLEPSPATLRALGVEVLTLAPAAVQASIRLAVEHPGLSDVDCAVLALAQQEQALVLSGDRQLVKVATTALQLEAHGTLWALEQLTRQGIIEQHQAQQLREGMARAGRRLPR